MKKRVTRWIVMMAAVCVMMLFPAITGYAAEGTLMLSDPEGMVGGEIPVTVRIDGGGQPIGDVNVTLSYDTALLEFISGTSVEGGDGTLTLTRSGTGAETEMVFEMLFRGLAEGTAAIRVTDSTAYLFSDETLNLTAGESAVTIGPDDGTGGTAASGESAERVLGQESIEIGGAYYNIYENFSDALIPAGFSRSTVQYAGVEHSAIRQDSSGKVMLFMITGEEDPITVLYNESDSTFIRAERVDVSETFYIFVLSSADGSGLPEAFYETSLALHGVNFPAWQNMEANDFYLIYALSSGGVEGFYQYDQVDATYQRYVAPVKTEEPEEEEDTSTLGKVQKIITDNLLILAAAVGVIVLILFIIILVLSIKLGRRNEELENLYVGDDEDQPKLRKKSRSQFVGYDDDDDMQDDEDDYLEDDFEDEYIDDYADSDDGFEDDFEDEYDDYEDDEEEDMKEYVPGKSPAGGTQQPPKKDSYDDIDFIDV